MTDDTIVISVEGGDEVQDDIVAISFDGEVRWRASQANDQIQGGDVDLITVTGDRVVAQWDDHWRVLSLTDGTERVRQRHNCSGDDSTVADNAVSDGERIYIPCDDRLVVFRTDDLTLSWDEGPRLQGWDLAFPGDGFFITVQSIGLPERVMAIGHQ